MGKKVSFRVTQKDINNGHQGKSNSCAVFLGLKRELPNLSHVDESTIDVNIEENDVWIGTKYYKMPEKIARWIRKFDKDKKSVKPFTHTLILREW